MNEDDCYRLFRTFSQRVAKAVIKLNGTCFCAQCEEKLLELFNAIEVMVDEAVEDGVDIQKSLDRAFS